MWKHPIFIVLVMMLLIVGAAFPEVQNLARRTSVGASHLATGMRSAKLEQPRPEVRILSGTGRRAGPVARSNIR